MRGRMSPERMPIREMPEGEITNPELVFEAICEVCKKYENKDRQWFLKKLDTDNPVVVSSKVNGYYDIMIVDSPSDINYGAMVYKVYSRLRETPILEIMGKKADEVSKKIVEIKTARQNEGTRKETSEI
jgi:hypothetical protein